MHHTDRSSRRTALIQGARATAFALASLLLLACSSNDLSQAPAPPGPVGKVDQALTSAELDVLSFEVASTWTSDSYGPGTLTQSTDTTHGSGSLSVSGFDYGYTIVRPTVPLVWDEAAPGIVSYDIKLPAAQLDPSDYGTTSLLVHAPSAGYDYYPVATKSLNGLALGQYHTISYRLQDWLYLDLEDVLAGGDIDDFEFMIEISTATGNNAHLLDHITYGPASPVAQADLLSFEDVNLWFPNASYATLIESNLSSHGAHSTEIQPDAGFADLAHLEPLQLSGLVPTVISVDLSLPTDQVDPNDYGTTSLIIEAYDSVNGYWTETLGPTSLDGLPLGSFQTVQHAVPQPVQDLFAQEPELVFLTIALDVPSGNTGYLIDNVQFGGGSGCTPISDDNPCTDDSCDPITGAPVYTPVASGTACDDGDVCNGGETCDGAGVCQAGTPLDPDDENPCTADTCDPVTGVHNTPVPAGTSCADGNVCNGDETCSAQAECQAGTPLDPDDGNPCTDDSCDPVQGIIHANTALGTLCLDGTVCNGEEACDGTGFCSPGTPLDPDDQNPCTADSCDPIQGVQNTPEPQGTSCNNENPCDGTNSCDGAGTCQPGTPPDLDDGNPCTADSCDPIQGIQHIPVANGTACNDNNACTQTDTCQAGTCTGSNPVVCTAQDQCHDAGTCDPGTGACSNPAKTDGTSCDDSDACTNGDTCQTGTCVAGAHLPVDDGNPCTADACDPIAGVTHTPVAAGTSCADSDLCNGEEQCDGAGVCQGGTPLICDDGDACNGSESCAPATGCVAGTPPVIDDGQPCTVDSCDPLAGVQHEPVAAGTSCSNGDVCDGAETCNETGVCESGVPLVIDDLNDCTLDSCDPIVGVTHSPVAAGSACDLDACTIGGSCDSGGTCVGGTSIVPDDGDPCTVETCDPVTGIHTSVCTEDTTVATTVAGSMAFLYTGLNPAQQGVNPADIVIKRAAAITGRALDRSGFPVPGVRVSIVGHPELGYTNTQADGTFQMVVNGGGQLLVAFDKQPYMHMQRQLHVGWGEWSTVPDVVLIAPDPVVTTIDLLDTSEPFQVHQASVVTDDDGARQGTLLFPEGTEATMHMADGTEVPLETMNVRITEFTVGATGPLAMPGDLPATSAYTYAFEVNADEAVAAGAPSITFDQPLIYYVDNFLDFPAGTNVPVGSYNRERGVWVPEENGIVIAIVGNAGGVAEVDADGDALADASVDLEALGIGVQERTKLAELYLVGQSLWRVEVPHFTEPYDCNWGISFPPDADPPPDPPPELPDPPDECEEGGSIIACESQTLRETIPVAGTPFTLNYSSHRVPGRLDRRSLQIPLTGDNPLISDPGLGTLGIRSIRVRVIAAGKVTTWKSLQIAPNMVFDYFFEGVDASGRPTQGSQEIRWDVTYSYPGVYSGTSRFADIPSNIALTGDRARGELEMARISSRYIGIWDARLLGLGGWTLDVHHGYEAGPGVLQLGDGTESTALATQRVVESWPKDNPGTGVPSSPAGDGGPADEARFQRPSALAVAADGTIYVADGSSTSDQVNIRRITPDGIISRFAGLGYGTAPGYNGDGGQALSTQFADIRDMEVAPDGSLYIADRYNHRIRRIGLDGIVTTVAGNGTAGFSGDGGPATEAQLFEPRGIGLGRAGELYIADTRNHRVRKVAPDGTITTIGGNGTVSIYGAPPPTTAARSTLDWIRPLDVAEHPDGSVYATDIHKTLVRRYSLDGIATIAAGVPCSNSNGNCDVGEEQYGIAATEHRIGEPDHIFFDAQGNFYLADKDMHRVLQVDSSGIVRLFAKGLDFGYRFGTQSGDGAPATDLDIGNIYGLAVGPDGVYFTAHRRIYRTRQSMPTLSDATLYVRSPDRDEVYVFDWTGRHLATRTRNGEPVHEFGYGSSGLLSTVADASGNETVIERAPNGDPLRIIGPYGHTTELEMNADGYLETITDPLNQSVIMEYTEDGLLETFTDKRGYTSVMVYDEMGRLESDTNAAGGFHLLSKTQTSSERTLTHEQAEGTTKTYHWSLLPDGTYRRINTFPDGTEAIAEYGLDMSQTTWLPNGTVVTSTRAPDKRFGMQDPMTTQTIRLPSGLARIEQTNRTATLFDPVDPFSLTSEVTTNTINGHSWVTTYTSSNRRTERVTPEGRWTRTFVDAQGRLTHIELPFTLPVDFAYDARGRLITTTQGTRVTTHNYFSTADARNGYLQSTNNALSQLTTFERDAIGRILSQTAPDTSVTTFDWDENDNLTGLTPPGKPEHTQSFTPVNLQSAYTPPVLPGIPAPQTTFAFNLDRQPTLTFRPDTLSFERVYADGKLDEIQTPAGTIDYSYFDLTPCVGCAPGSLASITHPSGVNLAHTYDGHLVTSTTWSGLASGAISWSYNNDFRVTTETVTTASDTSAITFAYDDDGLTICASPTTCPGGAGALNVTYDPLLPRPVSSVSGAVTDTLTYNAYGELASYEAFAGGNPVFSEIVDTATAPRDELGRIVERTETNGGATVTYGYEYDLQGRLIEVHENGTLAQSFTYDDNGNRLSLDTPTSSISATYDDQDRLLTYGDFVYTYTDNGELLTKTDTSNGDITAYQYDVFGNLVRVDLPNGDVIEYLADGQNRRVGKRVNGVLVKQWLWADQLRIAAELDGSGNLVSRFVYGREGGTTPELVIQGSTVYRVISDHLGSVRALVNIADPQDVPVRLDYEAFGSVSGTGVGFVPQGFAGGFYDAETGLVRFGARDYEPVIGRWIAKDPIRFEGDGPNLYSYVLNDPVNVIDPTGLEAGAQDTGCIVCRTVQVRNAYMCKAANTPQTKALCLMIQLNVHLVCSMLCPPDPDPNMCSVPPPMGGAGGSGPAPGGPESGSEGAGSQ